MRRGKTRHEEDVREEDFFLSRGTETEEILMKISACSLHEEREVNG
jgi:hypothetical protein